MPCKTGTVFLNSSEGGSRGREGAAGASGHQRAWSGVGEGEWIRHTIRSSWSPSPPLAGTRPFRLRLSKGTAMVGQAHLVERLRELARNLYWTWQRNVINLFRDLDPILWRHDRPQPGRVPQRISRGQLERRAAEMALDSRIDNAFRRLSEYLKDDRLLGRDARERSCGAAGCLLLDGVRPAREPADLLRRPGRAGRRPPQERQRPGHSAGRHRPAVRPGLLPAVARTPTAGSRRPT